MSKDGLFDGFAQVGKALANGRRVELIDVLAQGERHVEALALELDQSVANTSHHLHVLARAGLVTTRRDGNRIFYSLASERVASLWQLVQAVASDHVEDLDRLANAYLGGRDGVDVVSRDELANRLRTGDAVVLDVRPEVEYAAGHIAGARSVPVDQVRLHLDALPKDVKIVAYCRGPFCVYADEAVRELVRNGRSASRLAGGFPEWRTAGLPVEHGMVDASSHPDA
ncbi:MAG TPA: metalloregulator ArsR/SmtB family transcription factor [Acidimicrobiales bacterium]|nr:metalloregulator ArsR/SmtB family transcription factor [Acidimicrobiales bacterium]